MPTRRKKYTRNIDQQTISRLSRLVDDMAVKLRRSQARNVVLQELLTESVHRNIQVMSICNCRDGFVDEVDWDTGEVCITSCPICGDGMSYCRFSDMDFGCDIYAYDSDVNGGITIHVASQRVVGDIPKRLTISHPNEHTPEEILASWERQSAFLETAEREPINGEFDGMTLYASDNEEFQALLKDLREAGYRFPDYILEEN